MHAKILPKKTTLLKECGHEIWRLCVVLVRPITFNRHVLLYVLVVYKVTHQTAVLEVPIPCSHTDCYVCFFCFAVVVFLLLDPKHYMSCNPFAVLLQCNRFSILKILKDLWLSLRVSRYRPSICEFQRPETNIYKYWVFGFVGIVFRFFTVISMCDNYNTFTQFQYPKCLYILYSCKFASASFSIHQTDTYWDMEIKCFCFLDQPTEHIEVGYVQSVSCRRRLGTIVKGSTRLTTVTSRYMFD